MPDLGKEIIFSPLDAPLAQSLAEAGLGSFLVHFKCINSALKCGNGSILTAMDLEMRWLSRRRGENAFNYTMEPLRTWVNLPVAT